MIDLVGNAENIVSLPWTGRHGSMMHCGKFTIVSVRWLKVLRLVLCMMNGYRWRWHAHNESIAIWSWRRWWQTARRYLLIVSIIRRWMVYWQTISIRYTIIGAIQMQVDAVALMNVTTGRCTHNIATIRVWFWRGQWSGGQYMEFVVIVWTVTWWIQSGNGNGG